MAAKPKGDRVRRKYEFIKAHRKQSPTEVMCRELGVAPSGYHQWLKCPQSKRAVEDARLLRLIRASAVPTTHHAKNARWTLTFSSTNRG